MKIICLSCGHKIDLGDAYDDYAGLVRCLTCGGMLDIKTEGGGLKAVMMAQERAGEPPRAPAADPAAAAQVKRAQGASIP